MSEQHGFIGGYEIDPARPAQCQICEKPFAEHRDEQREYKELANDECRQQRSRAEAAEAQVAALSAQVNELEGQLAALSGVYAETLSALGGDEADEGPLIAKQLSEHVAHLTQEKADREHWLALAADTTAADAERDALRQQVERLKEQMEHIANANTRDWDDPSAESFKAWAQNRARYTLAALSAPSQTRCEGCEAGWRLTRVSPTEYRHWKPEGSQERMVPCSTPSQTEPQE